MVNKNKIKELHNKLSSSKINSFDSIITAESFSSVLKDRFIAELNNLSLDWDLEPTTINKIVKNQKKIKNSKLNLEENPNEKNIIVSKTNIGIDIQKIDKLPVVKDLWEDDFYKNNFHKREIAHCLKKKNPYQSLAGIYSVKEAIFKIDRTSKKEIEIKYDKDGEPKLSGYSISISHDEGYAVAVAIKIIENENELNNRKIKSKLDNFENNINELKTIIVNRNNRRKKNILAVFMIITLVIIIYMLFKNFL